MSGPGPELHSHRNVSFPTKISLFELAALKRVSLSPSKAIWVHLCNNSAA